jgi:hypothetical protein
MICAFLVQCQSEMQLSVFSIVGFGIRLIHAIMFWKRATEVQAELEERKRE